MSALDHFRLLRADARTEIHDLTLDSRAAGEGSLFLALHGAREDGADYAKEAAARGAVCVVTEHAAKGVPCVLVPDAHEAAAKLAAQGLSGSEIAERVRALAPKVEASFLIERLDYMRKGGRCSAVAALGANLLHLKPCIEVRNGKMAVCKKYRGSFEKCIRQYVKERLDGREDIAPELAFITHAAADANVVAAAKEEAAQYGSFETVEETQAGCTVSCHCGPNTLGILFVRK